MIKPTVVILVRLNKRGVMNILSPDDVETLRTIGVTPGQISILEQRLPLCGDALRPAPPMAEVRKALDAFIGGLEISVRSLDNLTRDKASDATKEAHFRIRDANWPPSLATIPIEGPDLEALSGSLHECLAAARISLNRLPKEQRRSRASPWVVGRIDAALQLGWGIDNEELQSHYATAWSAPPPPAAYPFVASASNASLFYQVVATCLTAITRSEAEPERAIRAYLKVRKKWNLIRAKADLWDEYKAKL